MSFLLAAMDYCVYLASFVLQGGEKCTYVGYTKSLERRERSAKERPKGWMAEMKKALRIVFMHHFYFRFVPPQYMSTAEYSPQNNA